MTIRKNKLRAAYKVRLASLTKLSHDRAELGGHDFVVHDVLLDELMRLTGEQEHIHGLGGPAQAKATA